MTESNVFIRLSMHSNSFSSHECYNFQILKQNSQFMSTNNSNNSGKTNQWTHPPLIQKENTFKNMLRAHLARHHTLKIQKYSNITTLNP